jgi:prephenate dehydrogenase
MWRDIALANREAVLAELDAYTSALEALRDAVAESDADHLLEIFSRARAAREHWINSRDV